MVIIHGQKGTTPEVDRTKGCSEALAANPGVKVVGEQWSEHWHQDEGFKIDAEHAAGPSRRHRSSSARPTRSRSAPRRRSRSPTSATRSGLAASTATSRRSKALKDGVFDVTATQQTQMMGRMARRFGDQVVAGEEVPAEQLQDATLTTKENVEQFIANHP